MGKTVMRRGMSVVCAAALAMLAVAGVDRAAAQDYPNRTIVMYNGFPAGTSPDIVSRHFANQLKILGGQTVIVENKVGANAMIAMQAAGRAKPDGYTLLFGPGASAATVQQKTLPFDADKDFVPIAAVIAFPFYLLVDPEKTPAKDVAELVALLRKKGTASYGAPNTLSNVGGALLVADAKLQGNAVQYKSTADVVRDLKAGFLDFAFIDAGFALSQMRSGNLRGLAVSMVKRAQNAPDLPTMKELGYQSFDFQGWLGVHAPAGIPAEAREKLETWLLKIATSEETKTFYKSVGAETFALSSREFAAFEKTETAAWKERAAIAKIEPQ